MDRTSNAIAGRTTRRAVDAGLASAARRRSRAKPAGRAPTRNSGRETMAHLGPYAILIAAVREELEQFVASHLRLHLAIAEGDRYVLTSIEVECEGSDEHRELLRRVHLRVQAGTDQELPRARSHCRTAQRERHRFVAVRRPQRGTECRSS